jgi:hypothetical protein
MLTSGWTPAEDVIKRCSHLETVQGAKIETRRPCGGVDRPTAILAGWGLREDNVTDIRLIHIYAQYIDYGTWDRSANTVDPKTIQILRRM